MTTEINFLKIIIEFISTNFGIGYFLVGILFIFLGIQRLKGGSYLIHKGLLFEIKSNALQFGIKDINTKKGKKAKETGKKIKKSGYYYLVTGMIILFSKLIAKFLIKVFL